MKSLYAAVEQGKRAVGEPELARLAATLRTCAEQVRQALPRRRHNRVPLSPPCPRERATAVRGLGCMWPARMPPTALTGSAARRIPCSAGVRGPPLPRLRAVELPGDAQPDAPSADAGSSVDRSPWMAPIPR
jgi:hypothetical protein